MSTKHALSLAVSSLLLAAPAAGYTFPDPLEGDYRVCSSVEPGAVRYNTTDGVRDRCFLVILPEGVPQESYPLPVLMVHHGMGGDSSDCDGLADNSGVRWVDLARRYGFILLCPESTQYNTGTTTVKPGGLWTIPFSQNSSTGTRCEDDDSVDMPYFRNVLTQMKQCPDIFDLRKLTFHGCSAGSTAALYHAMCFSKWIGSVPAFATHSTGMKLPGDGIDLPAAVVGNDYDDCETCEFYPVVPPINSDIKACVYDSTEDPNSQNPFYYESSQQLAAQFTLYGNRVETSYAPGGHCNVVSNKAIMECLDDGVGNLITIADPAETTATPCTDDPPNSVG
jgi:hypothetical protein